MVTKINTKIIKCTRCSNFNDYYIKKKLPGNNNSNEYYRWNKNINKIFDYCKNFKKIYEDTMFEYENSFKNKNIKKQKINNHGAFKYSKHTCCECGSSTNTLYQFLTIYMTNIYFLF